MAYKDTTSYWYWRALVESVKLDQQAENEHGLCVQVGDKHGQRIWSDVNPGAWIWLHYGIFFFPVVGVRTYDKFRFYFTQRADSTVTSVLYCVYLRARGANGLTAQERVWSFSRGALNYTGDFKSPEQSLANFYGYTIEVAFVVKSEIGVATIHGFWRALGYNSEHGEPATTVAYTELGSWADSCPW